MERRAETANMMGNQKRTSEILHFRDYDAVVNKTYPDQQKVKTLLDTVKDGIPASWSRILTVTPSRIYRDSKHNPKYVAKVRRHATPTQHRENIEEYKKYTEGKEWASEVKASLFAKNSLLNEIKLAPIIRSLLTKEEMNHLVQKYGFDDITLIEPLIGLIEKSSGKKIMFYEWQTGDRFDDTSDEPQPESLMKLHETNFIPEFQDFFRRQGITSSDLGTRQLLANKDVHGKNHLYLLDIEDYARVSTILM